MSASAMTTYLLNSPVLTAYGEYSFSGPLSAEAARHILNGGFTSAVGHVAGADFLSSLLHLPVIANRISIQMQPGDQAIIFRLLERLPEGTVLSETSLQEIKFDLSLLVRRS